MLSHPLTAALALAVSLSSVGCAHEVAANSPHGPARPGLSALAAALRDDARGKLGVVRPSAEPRTPAAVLGRKLFFEPRLSADGNVSCFGCHLTELGGGDGRAKSIGVHGKEMPRNAPTIFNVGLQQLQHWRAERESLEVQASRALLGPASFGNRDETAAVRRLRDAGYEAEFARAFPGEQPALTLANFGKAVAAYERSLTTPGRFDAFLSGDDAALAASEQRGLRTFLELGCAGCHSGPGLGGEQLRKFGIVKPYAAATHVPKPDPGRFELTQAASDRFVFKVPQLRNVASSGPYFHDGSVAELSDAVRIMAEVQLGQGLAEAQLAELVAFLRALSGPAPAWFSAP